MRAVFILISLFSSCLTFGQDTLVLKNGNQFGFGETYILNEDATFSYYAFCHCTGPSSIGKGSFLRTKLSLTFTFDDYEPPKGTYKCTKSDQSNQVQLSIYCSFDSTIIDFYGIKDSIASQLFFTTETDTSIDRPMSDFSIDAMQYEPLLIPLDSTCSSYSIYLKSKLKTVVGGKVVRLKKKKKYWIHKEKINKDKSIYLYDFKL